MNDNSLYQHIDNNRTNELTSLPGYNISEKKNNKKEALFIKRKVAAILSTRKRDVNS